MKTFKRILKSIGKHLWDFFKGALPSLLIYACAGSILMMLTWKDEKMVWDSTSILWTCVCIVAAAAYNGLLAYAQGGNSYEMLVSGNIKRRTADEYGDGYHISKHKEEKEYRVWKGFAIGGIIALFPLIFGIIAGNLLGTNAPGNGDNASWGTAVFFMVSIFISGWSVMPFYLMNANGFAVSYYWSCLFGIVPIAVSGALYIIGAYARRNKALREQRIADAQAAAQANKEKKINYGALPGTKPRKRK